MTRQIRVGNVLVGGGAPVSIQSMLNTKTTDVEGSLRQLKALQAAGCQIARLAVPNGIVSSSLTLWPFVLAGPNRPGAFLVSIC